MAPESLIAAEGARRPRRAPSKLLRVAAPLVAFAAITAALLVANGSPSRAPEDGLLNGSAVVAAGGEHEPDFAALGDTYYERARETGNPAFYSRSQRAFAAALARDPEDVDASIGLGTLALARHDFSAGLELGRRAHRLVPGLVRPYAVIADAQIELGRYAGAAETIERLVRLKPNLAAYARVSYFRELQGDLGGAVQAMRLAVSAGGSLEGSAYVTTLLGGLEFDRGHYTAAEHAYREALAGNPRYPPALAGAARVAAARGRLAASIGLYRQAAERLPAPEYAIALAEVEQAAGRKAAARRDLARAGTELRMLEAAGEFTGAERALFEADHGDPARAVAAGRRAWLRAPSVRSADAYSWALHAAGRTDAAMRLSSKAMRLSSRTPTFLYHAGMIALAAGHRAEARADLSLLIRQSPRFHPLHGPRARRALERLR